MHELEGSVICLDIDAAKRHRGRLRVETKYPDLKKALEEILDTETAGNPMKDQKWVRSSLAQLALKLKEQNIDVSGGTVSRVLKDMGYSMKVNIKKRKGFGWNSPDRDEQFKYIASMRRSVHKSSFYTVTRLRKWWPHPLYSPFVGPTVDDRCTCPFLHPRHLRLT